MGEQVQRFQTAVSEPQMAAAILGAWHDLFNTVPTQEQVSIVLAQNALETGNRKSMWNYNVGNIKANPKDKSKDAPNYYFLNAPEQLSPGQWKNLDMAFRAYPTLKDGVLDYLKLLSTSSRYAAAWQHILHPDPAAFSKALKQGGYYTADESQYTKLMSSLYNRFNKSDSYNVARSGQVPSTTPTPNDDLMKGYMATHKDQNIWDQLGMTDQRNTPQTSTPANDTTDQYLQQFLQQIAASEKQNKNLYKKLLPRNHMVIKINAAQYTDAVEFARILCAALDEELMAQAFTHTDGTRVEVECSIHGPEDGCFETVRQLSNSVSEAFKSATAKIGGINIKTACIVNKKSSYQEIGLQLANNQHRKFLLKFV